MLQAAAEVQAAVLLPEAPAAQALLEVIIAIKKARLPRVPCNTLTVRHTRKKVRLVLVHQSVLRTLHTL